MSRHLPRLAGALLLAASGTIVASGQVVSSGEAGPSGGEGPLQNDVFLPLDEAAHERLFAGDAKLSAARGELAQGRAAAATRLFTEAWDAWLAAAEAGTRASVGLAPEKGGRGRSTEGLAFALTRRIGALAEDERAAWLARAEPTAANALAATRDAAEELDVARSFPGTRAAALGALRAADGALESGRDETARALVELGRANARLGVPDEALARAFEERLAVLPEGTAPTDGARWREANELEAVGAVPLEDPAQPRAGLRGLEPGAGVRPGLVWMDGERIAIQTAGLVHLATVGERGITKETRFAPGELLAESVGVIEAPFATRTPPGWPLLPAARDGVLYVVEGRAFVPRGGDASEPNALIALEPPARREESPLGPRLPSLRWAVSGNRHVDAAGNVRALDRLAPLAGIELQPGLVFFDDTLVVQARLYGEKTQAWLLALELATGEPRWSLFLAQGSDLDPSASRFGGGTGPRLAAAPLLRVGQRVLATTHLGAAVLVDLVDGRPVWSLAYRRREAGADGWSGARPLVVDGGPEGSEVLLAPADSDRLYRLTTGPLERPEATALWRTPPAPIGGAQALVGGGPREALVLGRSGAAHALSRRPVDGADPIDALHLGPDETFSGDALVGPTRVVAATDRGLYLFDRERDLYLLDYATLAPVSGPRPDPGSAAGCSLFARDALVLALGIEGLWAFRTR